MTNEDEQRKLLREQMSIKEIGPKYFEAYSLSNGQPQSKIFSDTYSQNRNGEVSSNTSKFLEIIKSDTGIITEYWKALVIAHECNIEEKDSSFIYSVKLF